LRKSLLSAAQGSAITLRVWRFDSISNARTRRAVEEHITETDVLMVAADGRQPLPRGIEIALGEWLLGPTAARLGLVALLPGISDVQKPMGAAHLFLQDLAAKAGADFLSHSAEERALPSKDAAKSILSAGIGFFGNDHLRSTDVPRRCWGINERGVIGEQMFDVSYVQLSTARALGIAPA
jgi:hypothetical protein